MLLVKNASGERDPGMHQTKKGNDWQFGMKEHVRVRVEIRLVRSLESTSAHLHHLTSVGKILTRGKNTIFADSSYRGTERRT